MSILIKGGRVINPATQMEEEADVLIEEDKVVEMKKEHRRKSRSCIRRKRLLCYAGIH